MTKRAWRPVQALENISVEKEIAIFLVSVWYSLCGTKRSPRHVASGNRRGKPSFERLGQILTK